MLGNANDTCKTIVLTIIPATGTRFISSHSSPALRQPLSNILLSPGCISQRIEKAQVQIIQTQRESTLRFEVNFQAKHALVLLRLKLSTVFFPTGHFIIELLQEDEIKVNISASLSKIQAFHCYTFTIKYL